MIFLPVESFPDRDNRSTAAGAPVSFHCAFDGYTCQIAIITFIITQSYIGQADEPPPTRGLPHRHRVGNGDAGRRDAAHLAACREQVDRPPGARLWLRAVPP